MSPAEKIQMLETKAADLIQWFVQKPAPTPPFQLNGWTVVNDARKYFKTQLDRIAAHKGNPYHKIYIAAYYELLNLKNYMENAGTDNGHPGKLRKISQFGNSAESVFVALGGDRMDGDNKNDKGPGGTGNSGSNPSVDVSGTMRPNRSKMGKTRPVQTRNGKQGNNSGALPGLFS